MNTEVFSRVIASTFYGWVVVQTSTCGIVEYRLIIMLPAPFGGKEASVPLSVTGNVNKRNTN